MNVSTTSLEPRFSLVFVNFHSGKYLAKALESLFLWESPLYFEVIVVNNDEKEAKLLQSLQSFFPFRLIESGENLGYGGGINRGSDEAKGNIYGFLNPDTLWQESTLLPVEKCFLEEERLGVLGLSLRNKDGSQEAWSSGRDMSLFRLIGSNFFPSLFRFPDRRGALPSGSVRVDWVSGGALFVRKEIFKELHGFDERFFLYFEDVDFCRRVRERGFRIALCQSPRLLHFGGRSQTSPSLQKRAFYASQETYFKKYFSPLEYGTLRLLRFLRYGF